MAQTRLYQFRDLIAGQVIGPIIAVNRDAAAVRHFQEILADQKTTPGQHPLDFELVVIGVQDTDTGDLAPMPVETIYTGSQWARERARAASAPLANDASDTAAPLQLDK